MKFPPLSQRRSKRSWRVRIRPEFSVSVFRSLYSLGVMASFSPPQQDFHVEGLGYIVLSAHVKAREHIFLQLIGRQKDDRKLRAELLDFPAQVKAVPVRAGFTSAEEITKAKQEQYVTES